MKHRTNLLVLSALLGACSGAATETRTPPPTASAIAVAPVAPPPSASAPAPKPPPTPLAIGSKFEVDPDEPLPKGAVARCGTTRMRAADPLSVAVTNTGSIYAVDRFDGGVFLRDVNAGVDVAKLPGARIARWMRWGWGFHSIAS